MTNRLKNINIKLFPGNYIFSPNWIVLGVNNVCNLHCKMCDVGTQNLKTNFAQNLVGTRPINMPIELIQKIVDQTASYYPKAKLGFAFTEPMVYPKIEEAITMASEKKLYTTITTNALALPQKAEKLVHAGLNELYISLDGLEEIHNEIRGHNKSFQKAIEGLVLIKSFKNAPKITIVFAITEWNQHTLIEFADYFKDLPINEIAFMHTQFGDPNIAISHNNTWADAYPATESNLDEVNLTNMNLATLHYQIQQIKSNKYPYKIYFSPENNTLESLENYYLKPDVFFGKTCHDIFSNIMIKTDGSAIPAHGRCFNLKVGNLHDNNLKEIWTSSVYNKFRKDLIDAGGLLPACSRCCSAFSK